MSNIALPVLSSESSLSSYMNEVNKFPYLSAEEELELANLWAEKKNVEAAHKLVTSHLRYVVKLAMGFKGYGLPIMEMISEGNLGLMHAVKKFDPKKGFRLATYAMWWIKASIQEYILHSWSLVKIGTTKGQKKLFFNLRKLKNRLNKIDDNALSFDEVKQIANELEVSESEVVEMDQRLSHSDQSLNVPYLAHEEGSAQMIDYLEDDGQLQEEIIVEENEQNHQQQLLANAISSLNEREQDIISQRHLSESPATLEDLSQKYNISRERVRQIEARALEKIKNLITQL